jgi:hypothetical protein
VASALKAIDPHAELVHLEGKRWWLGIVAPNPEAGDPMELASAAKYAGMRSTINDPAERAMMEVELGREFQMRQIMAAGFRPVELYVVEDNDLSVIVEDFRIRDHNFRTKTAEQIEKEFKAAISMDALNRRRILEWGKQAAEVAAEAFRFVFKGARSSSGSHKRQR